MDNANSGMTNNDVRILKGWKLWGYSLGALGQILPISFFNTYAFQYYVYTVGLDPLLTSIGVFLGLFIFAFSSPIFGVMVDNKKPNKFGKRRPLMLFCIPLLLVFMVIAWMPPLVPVESDGFYWPTTIYFWGISIGIDLNQGLVVSTYLSMLAEQTNEPKNRMSVASVQGLFMILGTVASIFLPIVLQSKLEDPKNPYWNTPSGQYLVDNLPLFGLIFGVIGALCFISVFFSTNEDFHLRKLADSDEIAKESISDTFKAMLLPTKDRNYKYFMGNMFFFNMSLRILIIVLMPFLTYVMLLEESKFIWFIVAIIPFAGGGYALWNKIIRKHGIKKSYLTSMITSFVVSLLTIVFLLDMSINLRFILGVVIIGIAVSSLVGGYLFPNPIVAQLVDDAPENIKKQRKDITGSYFGLYIFTYNIAQAIASLILGSILTGQEDNAVLINWTLPVSGLFVLIAYFFMLKLKIENKLNQ